MKKIIIISVWFGLVSLKVFASALEVEYEMVEQRWYSLDDIAEKRSSYGMVDISRGYIEYYFEGDAYANKYPEEKLSPREKFYSNHGRVGTHAAADYMGALEKACVEVVSGSLESFRGSYETYKRPDRQRYKRMIVGIRPLTYTGPRYNFKSPASWSPVVAPRDKKSLLCEVYKVKSEASDVKYVVYAASMAASIFDEIYTAPSSDNKGE